MPAQYLPTVAWETIVRDVVVVDATHYYVSVYPENPNDPGSDLLSASVGQYLKDWIGHTYKIVEVNVGGVPLRLRVEDSFLTGVGPQQGLTGIVYKSPSGSPFLAPIRHFRLDESALDYSRAIELDVIWRNLLHLDQTIPQTITQGQPTFGDGLKLGLTPSVSGGNGEMYYDTTWKCMSFNNGDGTISQMSQEAHIYVYNNSGVNILEGQAVYDTGSGGDGIGPVTTTVALARADRESTSNVIGVATNNISVNTYGKVTIRGKINKFNTTAFGVEGNLLYLSATTAGLLTTVKPTVPNIIVRVGKLDVNDATNGSIEVSSVSWADVITATDLKATQNPGICAETPIGIEDISIDYTNRIVTITPPLGYFHYFTDGNGVINKHEVVGPISFTPFANTTGVWHFYFDNNGIVAPTQVPWSNFSLIAPVLRIVWDSTKTPDSAKALTIFGEYHLNDISAIDHLWKHTYGSIWVSGLDIFSNFLTAPGNPNADGRNTVIGLSSGTMMDDNLPFSVTNTATPTTFWQQNLGSNTALLLNSTNSAILKVRYKGGAGVGVVEDGTRYPFLWDIATNQPQYVNSSGVKTLVSNGYFFVYFVYGIPDGRSGNTVRITPAYSEYSSQTDANAVTWETVQTQDAAAKDTEIRPLYKLVFETKNSFGVGCKYTVLRSVVDIRKSVVTQTTSSIGSILASNVVYTPFTGITSTNVQALGLELYNKFQGTLNYLPKYNATGITDSKFTDDGTTPKYNTNTIWHAGNDGSGSGLDADTIDSYHGSDLFRKGVVAVDANSFNNIGTELWTPSTLNRPTEEYGTILNIKADVDWKHQLEFGTSGDLTFRENINSVGWTARKRIWNSANSNLSSVDWTAKDLTVTTAKVGSLSGYLKGTAGVVGAVFSIPESDISFTDITTGNVSTLKHGFIPKLSGSATDVFKGDGTWGSGGGSSSSNKLISFYSDSATVGTGITTLYSFTVVAGTMSSDGDCIDSEFVMTGAIGTTNSSATISVESTSPTISGINFNGGSVIMKSKLIRTSNTTARFTVWIIPWSNPGIQIIETSINGLDLSSLPIILSLSASTPSGAVVAKSGTIYKF